MDRWLSSSALRGAFEEGLPHLLVTGRNPAC